LNVEILASTTLDEDVLQREYDYDPYSREELPWSISDADALGEAAGRICYQSWGRKNPATRSNAGYLASILDHGHYSVLEHASVTFLVRGISRALLAELSRHRHLSFSVVSQRYVSYADSEPVIPPALVGTPSEVFLRGAYKGSVQVYERLVETLTVAGLGRKQAREAARAALPNAAPVDMVVTGNLRAWRDVLGKRHSVHADAEIQELARLVLGHLRSIAPNSVQDIAEEPAE
jgi:thymidylate synthase (FAD)